MEKGIVKWFSVEKGFGFIKVKGRKDDVFVHLKDVHNSGYDKLYEKDIVEFEIVEDSLVVLKQPILLPSSRHKLKISPPMGDLPV